MAAIGIGLVGGVTQVQIHTWLRNNLDLTKVRVMTYQTTVVLEDGTLPGLMVILAKVDIAQPEFDSKVALFAALKQLLTDFPSLQLFVTYPYEARAIIA